MSNIPTIAPVVRDFKSKLDADEQKSKRYETTVNLRKDKRGSLLDQKRHDRMEQLRNLCKQNFGQNVQDEKSDGPNVPNVDMKILLPQMEANMPARIAKFLQWAQTLGAWRTNPDQIKLFVRELTNWNTELVQLNRVPYPFYMTWFKSVSSDVWNTHHRNVILLICQLASAPGSVHPEVQRQCVQWIKNVFSMKHYDAPICIEHGWVKGIVQSVLYESDVDTPGQKSISEGQAKQRSLHGEFLNIVLEWSKHSTTICAYLLKNGILQGISEWLRVPMTADELLWILYLWTNVTRCMVKPEGKESGHGRGVALSKDLYVIWEKVAVQLMVRLVQTMQSGWIFPQTRGNNLSREEHSELGRAMTFAAVNANLVKKEAYAQAIVPDWKPTDAQITKWKETVIKYSDHIDEWVRGVNCVLRYSDDLIDQTTGDALQFLTEIKSKLYKMLLQDDVMLWMCSMIYYRVSLTLTLETVCFMIDVVADNEWIRERKQVWVFENSILARYPNKWINSKAPDKAFPIIVYGTWLESGLSATLSQFWIAESQEMGESGKKSQDSECLMVKFLNNLMVEDTPIGSTIQMQCIQSLAYPLERIKTAKKSLRDELMYLCINSLHGLRWVEVNIDQGKWLAEWFDINQRMALSSSVLENMTGIIENYMSQIKVQYMDMGVVSRLADVMETVAQKSDTRTFRMWCGFLKENEIDRVLDSLLDDISSFIDGGSGSDLEELGNRLVELRTNYFGERDQQEQEEEEQDLVGNAYRTGGAFGVGDAIQEGRTSDWDENKDNYTF